MNDVYCYYCEGRMYWVWCDRCDGMGSYDGVNYCSKCEGHKGWFYCSNCDQAVFPP